MSMHFLMSSEKKYHEARHFLPRLVHLRIDIPEIQELDMRAIIEAKLNEARKVCKGELVVEDTSLCLSCLNDLPGPLIKWFVQSIGVEGLYDLVCKYGNNNARAYTTVGYMAVDGKTQFFIGEVHGIIVAPRGDNGFGWDQIFVPQGHEKTFAEMPIEEKNAFSSRARAFEALASYVI